MGSHPINLAARFLLELAGLGAIGAWGWQQGEGFLSVTLAVGLPLLAAALWGTFAVPDDPSRSGRAPVPVPGLARLALEVAYFGFATWALHDFGASVLGWILGGATLIHYALSYDRLAWLLRQRPQGGGTGSTSPIPDE